MIKNEIDEYIAQFPEETQEKLNRIRETIREVARNAMEKIGCQMPTFYSNGNLVHSVAYKNHIGFYPTPSGIEVFTDKLGQYKYAKWIYTISTKKTNTL